ncbi:hypothetical protein PP175_25585 (plasmid) [Aneurinibacillus sp. Ricciae_BoGa-3]|uniref:hypothetical protein n=1 Tax=Aneurinibacillus sp. Ricciae_BoGa-3 TaxID=3022697 RepID=UPI00233FE324|nr:hypothetical protein [Aneurinibacillus sp. Ricciae_BoGa-3]WCK57442.1 hypothetical protein PP175_25585 [Aneurinibacillus sp. Ricciae_BoGa-3]
MQANAIYGIIGKQLTLQDIENHKREGFVTNQSDLTQYNGKKFTIVRSLVEGEVDLVVAPMFKVRFEDGFETDAYMDEVYQESLLAFIKEENLVRN